ncbi:hypothetical protein VPNG_10178 [Cytospora leucostoma]|uniref:Uncharacterized protein n=1 Tax=Cytospora leucostoma TaxID=1230097 RepID=A0A423VFN3_9PEZI|nr:hypothetical protein VPNG_10178 [Cytospora leucostoma]
MGDHLQQRLSTLKENIWWLENRMQEMRDGPLASLKSRRSVVSYKDGGVGVGSSEPGHLSRVLFSADELQAIRDLIVAPLVIQEQFNAEMFITKTTSD